MEDPSSMVLSKKKMYYLPCDKVPSMIEPLVGVEGRVWLGLTFSPAKTWLCPTFNDHEMSIASLGTTSINNLKNVAEFSSDFSLEENFLILKKKKEISK